MTTKTITLRVDAAEHAELAGRAERDKVSLSDYIRVRLGLRGEGPQDDEKLEMAATDERQLRALLADHDRRLGALEADRRAHEEPHTGLGGALERKGERVNGAAD